jgi:hypothetical protein
MTELIQEGTILSTKGNCALVKIVKGGVCAHCHINGFFGAPQNKKDFTVKAHNVINAAIGEQVVLKVTIPHFFGGLLLIFGSPILFLLIGYIGGHAMAQIVHHGIAMFSFGFMGVGLLGAFSLIILFGNRFRASYSVYDRIDHKKKEVCAQCTVSGKA